MISADTPASRLATRLGFLVAGFGIACWAPMVPFIKHKLAIDESILGLLILCIGVGSVCAMVLSGIIAARMGSRPVILASGFSLLLILPLLTVMDSPMTMGLVLLAFGAALGSLDVVINLHAVEVEQAAGTHLMSGFHALFSLGGFLGAALMTALLSLGSNLLFASLACALIMLAAMAVAAPQLLRDKPAASDTLFVFPKGIVLLLAALTAIAFLMEGAILDWSALLITQQGRVSEARGGLGYMLFAIAMVTGRFSGDSLATRLGDLALLHYSGWLAVLGFVVLLASPWTIVALSGFLLIGLGAANIVPVLFRRAGRQSLMPAALAIAAVTTTGYAGILLGPALIGFVAHWIGLATSFWLLAAMMVLIPLGAKAATKPAGA
ncbi:MFS transporter [Gilvimarinus algae]|uniref:MFS transporter n=1 Tax=Gilvimarinus algae TaxID=3058037 RepID=A0ABT8TB67_9GAMM|nr:MFS transporter [Gilvimarinus sp. SDUM040014]MDO3381349.1 MFS transporter [Gilvimarinus sp. SDUM040014]